MLRNLIRVLMRRWYVLLLGLLLTAGLAYGAATATPSEFRSRALVLLLPSAETVGEGGNPLLALSGLEQPASLIVAQVTSAPARDAVAQRSETAEYLVALDSGVRGPVILIEAIDRTPAQSLGTLQFLKQRIADELLQLQEQVGAPGDSIIRSMDLTSDVEATQDSSATIRNVIAAIAIGLAGSGFLAFGLDGILVRRSARHAPFSPLARSAARGDPRERSTNGPFEPHEPGEGTARPEEWARAEPTTASPARPGRGR